MGKNVSISFPIESEMRMKKAWRGVYHKNFGDQGRVFTGLALLMTQHLNMRRRLAQIRFCPVIG